MAIEILLGPYEGHLLSESKSPRTITDYKRTIIAIDRDLPYGADVACEEELKAWLWRAELEPNTRATYYAAIRSFYGWAAKIGAITFDPSAEICRPKVPVGLPRVAEDEQMQPILTTARQPYLLWAQLAACAGLRCVEVSRLHREHITKAAIKVHQGKGNKSREVPTHPIIWAAVEHLPPGPLAPLSPKRISSEFIRYCQRSLNMRGVSMHRIRGWMATSTYRATKDIQGLRKALGHANVANTARYVSVADEQLQNIIAAVPTFPAADGATDPSRLSA